MILNCKRCVTCSSINLASFSVKFDNWIIEEFWRGLCWYLRENKILSCCLVTDLLTDYWKFVPKSILNLITLDHLNRLPMDFFVIKLKYNLLASRPPRFSDFTFSVSLHPKPPCCLLGPPPLSLLCYCQSSHRYHCH